MRHIHRQTEVEAIKFTETVAKSREQFSQFSVEDRADTPHSWSYWKHEDSLKTPGRFLLRTKEHGTMTVCIGDWLVKEPDTGHVTVMSEKRFNQLYRPAPEIKNPPKVDRAEEIHKAGIDLDKFRKQWNEEQIKVLYETAIKPDSVWVTYNGDWLKDQFKTNGDDVHDVITYNVKGFPVNAPMEWADMSGLDLAVMSKMHAHMAEEARKIDKEIMSNLPTATRAIMEAEDKRDRYPLKGDFTHVHRTDSTDPKTGPTDYCDRGTCEGCKTDG